MKHLLLSLFLALAALHPVAQTVGLITKQPGSLDGYVLMSPISAKTTYLIDKCGYPVHSWATNRYCGLTAYLMPDGTLFRPADTMTTHFNMPGHGGIIEKFDWDGNRLWYYQVFSDSDMHHHDIVPLPNGHVLVLMWELKTAAQAIAAGRDPANISSEGIWSEKIIEIEPVGATGGNVVWEWHAWDHLVQHHDISKANYGVVAQHPELLNLNYIGGTIATQIDSADWLHCNSLAYNAKLDQIILNSRNLSEMWFIDHSTTTAQSKSHTGGAHGKGGDFLYRWGNPAVYEAATSANEILYGEHNPHWIDSGLVGAGNIIVFNNGVGRPNGFYSQVEIFAPPVDVNGDYTLVPNQAYKPDSAYWKYTASPRHSLFSPRISGAQRLSNGNTLICEGDSGVIFEIDAANNEVWRYINPVTHTGIISQGDTTDMGNIIFKCQFFEPSYSAFAGHTLTPGAPLELNPLPYNCNMLNGIAETLSAAGTAIKAVNPFAGELWIEADTNLPNAEMILLDVTGRPVANFGSTSLAANSPALFKPENSLSAGVYFLNINSEGQHFVIKLIHP